ncbi:MAG: gliding motility-associated C-terminal domain-containing protein, partial [Bacteroidia bacterium]|nr:gliding motility-associated C-terminal domain-containing protein [Bacteroidia bacterium]
IEYSNAAFCTVHDTVIVKQNDPLLPALVTGFSICIGDTARLFIFKNLAIQYDSVWFYENGKTTPLANPEAYKVNAPTRITLQVYGTQNGKQCFLETGFNISINTQTDSVFRVLKSSTCFNENLLTLTSTSNASALSKTIKWGDASASEPFMNQVSHRYADTGSFNYSVYVSSAKGCRDTFKGKVNILPSPVASAAVTDSSGCSKISLTTSSKSGNTSSTLNHKLSWGDAIEESFTSNAVKQHNYASSGTYTIQLEVKNSAGCADTVAITHTIYPTVTASVQALGFCLGDSTRFSSVVSPSNSYTYSWQEASSVLSTKPSFSYLFPSVGSHKVLFTATSAQNCNARDSVSFNITEKPVAAFDFYPFGREATGIKYYFADRSKNPQFWQWTFGSQGSSILQNPEFIFSDTGKVRVRLKVTGGSCSDSIEKLIPILERVEFYFPNAFTPNDNNLNEGFGLSESQKEMTQSYTMEVYNRWGGKIFKTGNPDERWIPGTTQQGIYIYQASIRDIFGKLHDIKGVVEVLR